MSATPDGCVLVTGASTGIGRATVLRLARAGTVVYAGVRSDADAASLRAEGGECVRPLLLEVTDAGAIEAARAAVAASGLRLAGLVNNAGIAAAGPLELLPLAELRRQLEVNFVSAIALIQAFGPSLRAGRGRIVNVGSIGGKFAAPYVGAYAASKFALEAASDALRLELRPFGVRVVLVEPGAVKTPIWSGGEERAERVLAGATPEARAAYEPGVRALQRVARALARQGVEPERAARVIERALVARRPKARYLVGADARLRLAIARLPEPLRDRIVAAAMRP